MVSSKDFNFNKEDYMGDGFQINGFIKIKQYKKDGTVIRDEKLYNKVTDIGRQWFLHKGSSPILQNNLANFSQSDFYSHMDCNVTYENDDYKVYKRISTDSAANYLFNLPQELYNLHQAAGGAKNFIGDKNTVPEIVGFASSNANQKDVVLAAQNGLVINTSGVPIMDDFRVGQTWRYPEGCATGTINAIAMMQNNAAGNRPSIGFAKCLTPRILDAATDVGDVQGYIPPDVVYNRGKADEKVWTKPNEVIAHTSGNHTYRIELDTGKCTEMKPSELGFNKDFIVPGMAACINCTLYGVNKILYVAYEHNNIRVIDISATDITVSQGSATTSLSSDTDNQHYYHMNTDKEVISMFSREVSGERHVFIIGNYYYTSREDSPVPEARYFVSEWKLDGTRISISQALEFKAALGKATGADYSTVDDYLLGIIDAGDGRGHIALTNFVHMFDTHLYLNRNEYNFKVLCGRYFSDIANYADTLTDRALIIGGRSVENAHEGGMNGAAMFVVKDKLCAISFRGRSRRISKYADYSNNTEYDYNVATLSFSKEGWAGNLISMKLLKDPIVKQEDDILDITYGYEIGEKNDA